ncbi:hypothetical protein M3Y99_00693500 [Aphelenchoides fujianensis]|nr:hypothetical protein M3Y99_00693500 [Aphelenchoides fujianensis]
MSANQSGGPSTSKMPKAEPPEIIWEPPTVAVRPNVQAVGSKPSASNFAAAHRPSPQTQQQRAIARSVSQDPCDVRWKTAAGQPTDGGGLIEELGKSPTVLIEIHYAANGEQADESEQPSMAEEGDENGHETLDETPWIHRTTPSNRNQL